MYISHNATDPHPLIELQPCRDVALKTNEMAGDGTTTATVFANANSAEGIKKGRM